MDFRRWHWRAFLIGGGSAFWVLAYGIVYWAMRLSLHSVTSAVLYIGYLLLLAILWAFRHRPPGPVHRGFRYAQTVSAAAMAFGHGMQDASKTAGVVAGAAGCVCVLTGMFLAIAVAAAAVGVSALVMYLLWRQIRTDRKGH